MITQLQYFRAFYVNLCVPLSLSLSLSLFRWFSLFHSSFIYVCYHESLFRLLYIINIWQPCGNILLLYITFGLSLFIIIYHNLYIYKYFWKMLKFSLSLNIRKSIEEVPSKPKHCTLVYIIINMVALYIRPRLGTIFLFY